MNKVLAALQQMASRRSLQEGGMPGASPNPPLDRPMSAMSAASAGLGGALGPWGEKLSAIRASRGTILLLCLLVLLAALAAASTSSKLLTRDYRISHDTISYANTPGLAEGLDLSNFSSDLRTPGYNLFLAIATLGKLPNREAMGYALCGDSVFASGAVSCEDFTPDMPDAAVVRVPPVVYYYPPQTERALARSMFLAKALALASFVVIFFAMSRWIHPALSLLGALYLVSTSPIWSYPSLIDIAQTECLFPAVLFFYFAAMSEAFRARSGIWLVVATALAIFTFWVRPVFLYLVAGHVLIIIPIALFWWGRWRGAGTSAVFAAAALGWTFFLSPVEFFSLANKQSDALRAAMFTDERTLACVTDPADRTILQAYVTSVYNAPGVKENAPDIKTDLDRYYLLAMANSYRLYLPDHPIYKDASIAPYLDSSGLLPEATIDKAIAAASLCNAPRAVDYFFLTAGTVLGVTPQLTKHVPRGHFDHPSVFIVSATVILAALGLFTFQGRLGLATMIAMSSGVYLMMVAIVSLKQGGEPRYTLVAEPAFVFAAALAALALFQEGLGRSWALYLSRRRPALTPAS